MARKRRGPRGKTGYTVTGSFPFGPYKTKRDADHARTRLDRKSKKIQVGNVTGKRGAYRFRAKMVFLVGDAKSRDQVSREMKNASNRVSVSTRRVSV